MAMDTYGNVFPTIYDDFIGKAPLGNEVKKIILKHKPDPKNILELGCGTGSMLAMFPSSVEKAGIDISRGMLSIAKKKLPNGHFYHETMSSFSLSEKFDVIFCVFDSINHLSSLQEWGKTYQQVKKHLAKDGIFVFDVSSLPRMQLMAKLPGYSLLVKGKNRLFFNVLATKNPNRFITSLTYFRHIVWNFFYQTSITIPEVTYTSSVIEKSIKKYFTISEIKQLVFEKSFSFKKAPRILYVCKLKK